MSAYPLAGQHTTAVPIYTFKSPGFQTRYPEIRNPELIHPGPKAAMEVSWNRGDFPEERVEIFNIKRAFLTEECLVLDDDLRFIETSATPTATKK